MAPNKNLGSNSNADELITFTHEITGTLSHQQEVALLVYKMNNELPDLSDRDRTIRYLAALLHDEGKFECALEVIFIPGRYGPKERAEIAHHPFLSYQLLMMKSIEEYNKLIKKAVSGQGLKLKPLSLDDTNAVSEIATIARQHHEHLDGSGYPDKLVGDEISTSARLLTVADVFQALTATNRPYRTAITTEEALRKMITTMGKKFDLDALATLTHVVMKREEPKSTALPVRMAVRPPVRVSTQQQLPLLAYQPVI